MDPKVCGKLLTTHGEGDDDDDDEGLRDGPPLPEQAPRWDLHGNRSYGGGITVFSLRMEFLGYVGICRKKEGAGGHTGQPRGRGRALGRGRAPNLKASQWPLSWISSARYFLYFPKKCSVEFWGFWSCAE